MSKWKIIELNDVCEFIKDGTHQTPKYSETGFIFLSSKNVKNGVIDWNDVKFIPNELHEKLYNVLKPQVNDILLAKNGTTGIAAIVDREEIFDVYVSLAVLRPNQKIINPNYLLCAINSPQTKLQFDLSLKGIGVPNLHLNSISKTTIPLPPLETQRKIAANLDKVNHTIDLCSAILEKLDLLVKSRFVEMFGDPVINPYNLETKKLSELSKLITKGASPKWQGFSYTADTTQTLFITSENVREGYIDITNPKYIEDSFNEKQKRSILKKGDFLINIVGASIGRAAQFTFNYKANINQATALVRIDNHKIIDKYLLIYLNFEKALQMYEEMKSDTGRANLSLEDIGNLVVLLPSLDLQEKFAAFVEQTEKSKATVKQVQEKAETLKKKLMQDYFDRKDIYEF